ncbi:hypothetical protein AKJ18_10760 [Vibrio xuii]|nr:hypothetical protein AKJ18_10760 [Vibrio xuii]
MVESAVRYDWYIYDSLSIYGRVGAAYWQMDRSQLSQQVEESGVSPLGEIGVNYRMSPNWGLSAGYQYIHSIGDVNTTGEYDSNALLLGLTYTFGSNANTQSSLVETGKSDVYQASDKVVQPDVYSVQEKIEGSESTKVLATEHTAETSWFKTQVGTETFATASTASELDLVVFAQILLNYPQAKIQLVGHADAIGSSKYNQTLSEKRAQAVASRLEQLGVDSTQIHVEGQGEMVPVASNDSSEGRAKNRRVDIIIQGFEYH